MLVLTGTQSVFPESIQIKKRRFYNLTEVYDVIQFFYQSDKEVNQFTHSLVESSLIMTKLRVVIAHRPRRQGERGVPYLSCQRSRREGRLDHTPVPP